MQINSTFIKKQLISHLKRPSLFFFSLLLLVSCRNNSPSEEKSVSKKDSIPETIKTNDVSQELESKSMLALTSNALQVVDSTTGSTREITFGIPEGQMVEILTGILGDAPNSIQINQECGAGPLKMATWNNGLTVIFQDAKQKGEWIFSGWFVTMTSDMSQKITTMAGIGIGSTRQEMEDAYVIEVFESTLGQEFSTTSGLYGIFDGASKNAKIINMWSGLSCNFR